MRVGTFNCERQDCPGGKKPCTLCGMPRADRISLSMIRIYQRCKERHALPHAGGVLDQPEDLMRVFDVIDDGVIAHRKKQAEDEQSREAREKLKKGGLRAYRRD